MRPQAIRGGRVLGSGMTATDLERSGIHPSAVEPDHAKPALTEAATVYRVIQRAERVRLAATGGCEFAARDWGRPAHRKQLGQFRDSVLASLEEFDRMRLLAGRQLRRLALQAAVGLCDEPPLTRTSESRSVSNSAKVASTLKNMRPIGFLGS